MSKTPGRLAAATVAVLVVIAVAVLALRAGGAGIAQGPRSNVTPSPASVEPTPTAPGATPSRSEPDETETLAILAEIERQVVAIRGLPGPDIGPAQIISRSELGAELQAIFDEEYPPDERERDNRALRAMGLLGPDDDVADLSLELLGDQVLGFYDDVERRMVVVSDAGLNVEARITYAHEYTHALQDAAFGLDSLETDAAGQDDRGLARTALIEGDATVTMLAWMLQNLSQQEILEYVAGAEIPDTSGIPSWMVAQLAFPYDSGLAWTTSLAGGDPTQPEFGEIDAAYDDLPDSTEQVIDIDKWDTRETPDPIETTDLAAALGDGWEEVESTPIGQATIEIMLSYFG
ncbi:MAG: hypothetical protein ABIO99_09265, partial [Candidatus Limnocylindria bacterium]